MRRGDVVRVELPRPVGTAGREQFGMRPAIVVQDEAAATNAPTVVIVPLTSSLSAARFAGSFTISPSATNGLDVESVVLTHQVRAIDKRRVEGVIGRVAQDEMENLDRELRKLLRL